MSPQEEEAACQEGLRLAAQATCEELSGSLPRALELYVEAIRVLLRVKQIAAKDAASLCLTKAESIKSQLALRESSSPKYPESSASPCGTTTRGMKATPSTPTPPPITTAVTPTHTPVNTIPRSPTKPTSAQTQPTSHSNTNMYVHTRSFSSSFASCFSSRSSSPPASRFSASSVVSPSPCSSPCSSSGFATASARSSLNSPASSRSPSPSSSLPPASASVSRSLSSLHSSVSSLILARSPSAPPSFSAPSSVFASSPTPSHTPSASSPVPSSIPRSSSSSFSCTRSASSSITDDSGYFTTSCCPPPPSTSSAPSPPPPLPSSSSVSSSVPLSRFSASSPSGSYPIPPSTSRSSSSSSTSRSPSSSISQFPSGSLSQSQSPSGCLSRSPSGSLSSSSTSSPSASASCSESSFPSPSESRPQKQLRLLNEAVAMDEQLHTLMTKPHDMKQRQTLISQVQTLYQDWLMTIEEGGIPTARVEMVQHRLKTLQCRLTPEERKILIGTSYINGVPYLPFTGEDCKDDLFLCDGGGGEGGGFESPLLHLSSRQEELFSSWLRPHQLSSKPNVVCLVSPLSIQQSVITDCSFVASISVAAHHEHTFKSRLISSCIFPQNEYGFPVYNPCGKYNIKLLLNGVERKVTIDDRLPADREGRLLCAASQQRGELWVSLIEKAFLQTMGGYDFPGSNSGVDLHMLTGWVPERVKMSSLHNDEQAKERLWERIHGGHMCGDALITVATGNNAELGLVSNHAYAILRVVEESSSNNSGSTLKLVQVKNPWAHTCWQGPFSRTCPRWTAKLRKDLHCESDCGTDNGVFWMDFDSVVEYFDFVCVNWNKDLFPHKQSRHVSWPFDQGPVKDSRSYQYNPQFRLRTGKGQVYILLSRHVTDKTHELTSKEFITCHVLRRPHSVNETELLSSRVYIVTSSEQWIHKGNYVNNPHYLVRLPCEMETDYTLIVSVFEKLATMSFTLNVFSTCPCTLTPIPLGYEFQERLTGTWKQGLAGGSFKNSSYFKNPQFRIQINSNSSSSGSTHTELVPCMIKIEAPKEFHVNAKVLEGCSLLQEGDHLPAKTSSSCVYMDGVSFGMVYLCPGVSYIIVVSTFHVDQHGPFVLSASSPFPFQLQRLL